MSYSTDHAEITLKSDRIEIIICNRQSVVTNEQIEVALAYFLPKLNTITLMQYPDVDRSDVIAQLPSDKIVERRHAISWVLIA